MARRSNFLVVTLLVMVGVLISAILLGGGSGESGPISQDPQRANEVKGDPEGAPRVAEGNARSEQAPADGGAQREAVRTGLPTAGSEKVMLRGRLVRGDNTAVAGAVIRFGSTSGPGRPFLRDSEAPRAETGGDGRFQFALSREARGQIEVLAKAGLLFRQGDRRSLDVELNGADKDLGDLVVVDALTLRGQVVDETGQALPLAKLRVNDSMLGLGFGGEDVAVDGEGRFVVVGLEPGSCHLLAAAPGFVPEPRRIDVTRDPPMKEQRFQLERGASVSGFVYDDLGRPIEGAKVNALRKMRVASGVDVEQFDSQGSVETSASGAFVIAGIEGETTTLRVSNKGHAAETVPAIAVGRSDVVVQLQRCGTISGVLRDASGAPLAGSEVSARTGGGDVSVAPTPIMRMPSETSAKTDEKGVFVIENVRPGPVTLSATGESHLPLDGVLVQVLPGSKVEHVQLVAEIGAALDVLVQDEKGKPVPGATVVIATPDDQQDAPAGRGVRTMRFTARARAAGPDGPIPVPGDELRRATTNAEGRALLGGLPARAVVVRATHESLAPAKPIPMTVPLRGTREVIATLRPAGFVTVHVKDAAGAAIGGARFVVTGPEGDDRRDEHGTATAEGSSRVGPLLAGHYTARVELPPEPIDFGGMQMLVDDNGASLDETAVAFDIQPGAETQVDLTRPVLATVNGTVTDANGIVRGAEVRLQRVNEDAPIGLGMGGKLRHSDADGHFAFDDVPAGRWRLEWKRPDRPVPSTDEFDVPVGVPSVQRDLRISGGSVVVHVTSAIDHQPLARADVTLRRAGSEGAPQRRMVGIMMMSRSTDGGDDSRSVRMQGGPGSVRTDDEGRATLEDVPPGEYELVVEHNKHIDGKLDKIVVADGAPTDAGSIELQPAGNLRGKVTGFAADDQIRAAMVVLHKVGAPAGEERRETAMSGSFHIERLAPGDYEIHAEALGSGEPKPGPSRTVTVSAGETARIEIPLGGS
ncbi:MAG: carboxypeptidase regulatory-like domain-containing protein [Planctomycetota bacterium]